MNFAMKVFFVPFSLLVLIIGCGGSKEEIQTITVGGSCHPKIDRKLGEPIIVVSLESLTEDTDFYELAQIVGGLKSLQSAIIYPENANIAGYEGKVYIDANIDSIGKITDLRLRKGIGAGCEESAMDGIKKQSFLPSKRKGTPINDSLRVVIIFKLQ
ncbi:MAG: TonB family protein [Ignavibacteriales bacterium]|nr:TonB family protein [Ignavibacteriales bacterium]